jgi:hypothetical protein
VVHRLRRIVVRLDRPTREGDTEVVLVTNLPAEVSAFACCEAYLGRWQIERHYPELTDLLHREVPALGYPRAALFAFGMAAVAGDALAVLKGGLRAAHGAELAGEISSFELVDQAAEVYPGMMIAVPPEHWAWVRRAPAGAVAGVLIGLAAGMPVHRMLRARRGPKRPRTGPKRSGAVDRHVSTQRLLDRAKGAGPPGRARNPDAITSYIYMNSHVHSGSFPARLRSDRAESGWKARPTTSLDDRRSHLYYCNSTRGQEPCSRSTSETRRRYMPSSSGLSAWRSRRVGWGRGTGCRRSGSSRWI